MPMHIVIRDTGWIHYHFDTNQSFRSTVVWRETFCIACIASQRCTRSDRIRLHIQYTYYRYLPTTYYYYNNMIYVTKMVIVFCFDLVLQLLLLLYIYRCSQLHRERPKGHCSPLFYFAITCIKQFLPYCYIKKKYIFFIVILTMFL